MMHVHDIAKTIQASYLQAGAEKHVIDNILLDSRRITHPETSIFFALVTEQRNAHIYFKQVYDAGVRCIVVSEKINTKIYTGCTILYVKNTLHALQQLVVAHRKKYTYPVIGITGSNGKTIVKEWLSQLCEKKYTVIKSPKSYNSQIGVPLSVWEMNSKHNLGIFEAGISQKNEMQALEKIIQPTIGIFTTIGEAHNEGFTTTEQKIEEKLLLFTNTQKIICNSDQKKVFQKIKEFAKRRKQEGANIEIISWGKNKSNTYTIEKHKIENGIQIQLLHNTKTHLFALPYTDDAYIENAIHAIVTSIELHVPISYIQKNISQLQPLAMRMELIKGINNSTIINDSYSNDIASLTIALDFLKQQDQHVYNTLILSDILQSGKNKNELYDEVAELVKQYNIHNLVAIGTQLKKHKKKFDTIKKLHTEYWESTELFLDNILEEKYSQHTILIKGARSFGFEKIALRFQERVHQTVLEVNLSALQHNIQVYKSLLHKNTKVMAMVKAFAYGSGAIEVANKLEFLGVDYLAVAYADEGVELRKNGIKLPIMVLNPDENAFDIMMEYDLEPEIYSLRLLQKLVQVTERYSIEQFPIHIKLDTGMHRLGFTQNELDGLINYCKHNKNIYIKSLLSHLAGSEEQALDTFTQQQADSFVRMSKKIETELQISCIKHLCNSSGIVRHKNLHFDMVRLGLGLYGIDSTHTIQKKLRQVSQLKTEISQLKKVSKQETIGYNRKGILKRDTIIGTVCIGYADGISRRLGNGVGKMLIHGKLAPIIGNVCMDMCMLDVTDIPNIQEGDEVLVFGTKLSVTEIASWAGTIPYEIFTGISQRVKRLYFEE